MDSREVAIHIIVVDYHLGRNSGGVAIIVRVYRHQGGCFYVIIAGDLRKNLQLTPIELHPRFGD